MTELCRWRTAGVSATALLELLNLISLGVSCVGWCCGLPADHAEGLSSDHPIVPLTPAAAFENSMIVQGTGLSSAVARTHSVSLLPRVDDWSR